MGHQLGLAGRARGHEQERQVVRRGGMPPLGIDLGLRGAEVLDLGQDKAGELEPLGQGDEDLKLMKLMNRFDAFGDYVHSECFSKRDNRADNFAVF